MQIYKKIVRDPIRLIRRHWNADGRGKLLECVKSSEITSPFGQAYVTTVLPGIIKAWHLHEHQTDRMTLLKGMVRFVCVETHDDDCGYDTVLDLIVSDVDPVQIIIPPHVYHGFQNMGTVEAYIMNVPDKEYNPQMPDEKRLAYDALADFPWQISLNG